MEVLIVVVVVHVPGHVEVHAPHGLHDLPHGLPLDDDVEIRHYAGEIGHLLFQTLHAAAAGLLGVEDAVNLLDRPGHVDHRVPGDAHHVHLTVWHVVGHQDKGVRIAAAGGVPADEQEGEVVLLPSGEDLLAVPVLLGLPVGIVVVDQGAVVVLHVRGPDKQEPPACSRQDQHGQQAENSRQGLLPAAPAAGGMLLLLIEIAAPASAGLPLAFCSAHVSFPFR